MPPPFPDSHPHSAPPRTASRVHGYARLPLVRGSTDEYRAECVAMLERYANERFPELTWAGVFIDEAKVRKKGFGQRPEAFRLQRSLNQGDVVLIGDSGRSFKSRPDLFTTARIWEATGVRVCFTDLGIDTGTDGGRWALGLLERFAEANRDRHGERTVAGKMARKRPALPNQHVGYPFKVVGAKGRRLKVMCEKTRAAGKRIVELKQQGLSWSAIYLALFKEKVQRHDGSEWSYGSIQRAYAAELALQQNEAAEAELLRGGQ